jgi:hypothetical protein
LLHPEQGAGDHAGVIAEKQSAERGDHRQLYQEAVVRAQVTAGSAFVQSQPRGYS